MSRHSAGCRCGDCHPGLSAYAPDPEAYERALAPLRTVKLSIVTMPLGDEPACDGTMTCSCRPCIQERVSRSALGSGPADPLRPRPSRHDPHRRRAA